MLNANNFDDEYKNFTYKNNLIKKFAEEEWYRNFVAISVIIFALFGNF